MKMVAPGKAMICSQQPFLTEDKTTNSWEEIASAIAQNKDLFELLYRITEKPVFDFGLNYKQGFAQFDFTNLHLADSRGAARRLEIALLNALHNHDSNAAVQ